MRKKRLRMDYKTPPQYKVEIKEEKARNLKREFGLTVSQLLELEV